MVSNKGTSAGEETEKQWAALKRRTGCIWSCLTEPLVVMTLVIASLAGAFLLGKRSGARSLGSHEEPPDD